MRVVDNLAVDVWRDFVINHPYGNIFHTPIMYELFARTEGYQPSIRAVVDSDQRVIALMLPVQIALSKMLSSFTTRAVVFGSVLFDSKLNGEHALELLMKTYAKEGGRNLLFTELRNIYNLESAQPIFANIGFIYDDHLNYLIDLNRPIESVFNSIGKRTRKNIRHGLNRGVVQIEEARKPEDIRACIQLFQHTYQNAGVPLAHHSLFENAYNLLHPDGMVRFTLATVNDEPAAASMELLYKDVVYGWYGGLDRNYSSYVPNELLVWHILKWGSENGFRQYDFGGAGKPDEEYGVRDFKAKFGGELVSFGRNTLVHSQIRFKISKLGFEIYRRLR